MISAKNRKSPIFCNSKQSAFTLIELIVVIAIIGILASIAILSFSSWRNATYINSIKSDANSVASAMENARNFGTTGYPANASSVFTASTDIAMSGGSADGGKTYCVDLKSSQDSTLEYYIDSSTSGSGAQEGTCATRTGILAPTTITATTVSSSSINVTFTTVSGATGYNLQQASDASFTDAKTIAQLGASPTLPYLSASLKENTTYYYRVQTIKTADVSSWSNLASAKTSDLTIAAPAAPTVTRTSNATTTTFTWANATCAAGYSARYQYSYDIAPITYSSGWRSVSGTNSLAFTTTTYDLIYSLNVRAQCYNIDRVSAWSTNGSLSYTKPIVTNLFGHKQSTPCMINGINQLVYCWGTNNLGQAGQLSSSIQTPAAAILGGGVAQMISGGGSHSCYLNMSGKAYCWGYNLVGQIGDSTNTTRNSATAVSGNYTFKTISSGMSHTCAITIDGKGYCWGEGSLGELGNYGTSDVNYPVAVYTAGALSGLTLKAISAGGKGTCAIASDNNAYCWGESRIAGGTTSSYPVAVNKTGALSGLTIKQISAGYYNVCAVASDNNAYCWGYNNSGEGGWGDTSISYSPKAVTRTGALNGLTVKQVSTYFYNACAIASDDNIYCWGQNGTYGALGNNSSVNSLVPVAVVNTGVLNGLKVLGVSAGNGNVCVLASDGHIYCWGASNTYLVPGTVPAASAVSVAVY